MIDFIWADTQGAEGAIIRGATETLKFTKYLYTEFSDYEMYEGQINLDGILKLLPTWKVLKIYETQFRDDNVLLENLCENK